MAAILEIVLKSTDKASKGLEKVGKSGSKAGELINKNWKQASLAMGAAGAATEALARSQQEQEKSVARLSAMTGLSDKEMRKFANSLSNVTFPLEDVTGLLEIASQQGVEGVEALAEYATFWDTVGDATGLTATELAKSTQAMKAVGIDATNSGDAMAAFGFITENTSIDVKDFLGFIEKSAPELKEMGLSIDQTAGLLGAMESELGLVGKTAKAEFVAAVNAADGSLEVALKTLGLSEEVLAEYTERVKGSSDVIQRNADIHAESFTPLQKFQHQIKEIGLTYGSTIKTAADFAPVLMVAGPVMKGVTLGVQALGAAQGLLSTAFTVSGAAARIAWIAITGPVGLAVLAIAGLVAAGVLLWKNWDTIKEKATAIFGGIKNFVGGVADSIAGYFEDIPARLVSIAKNIANLITMPYRLAFNGFRKVANMVIDALNDIPDFTVPSWVPGIGGNNFGIPEIPQIPNLPSFQGGGTVPGEIGQPLLAVVHGGEQIRNPGGSFVGRGNSGGGGGITAIFNFQNYVGTPDDLRRAMLGALVQMEQTGTISRITT